MSTSYEFVKTFLPLATVAGAVSIAIFQQSRADKRDMRLQERQAFAARSTLPLTLANLQHYVTECMQFFRQYYDAGSPTYFASEPALPAINEQSISVLEENILCATDQEVAQRLAYLVEKMQVQNSRMIGLFRKPHRADIILTPEDLDQTFYDMLFLTNLIDRFYDYGRRRSSAVNVLVEQSDMRFSALINGLEGPSYERLSKMIDLRPFADQPAFAPKNFFRRKRGTAHI